MSDAIERVEQAAFRAFAASAELPVLELAGATCIAHPGVPESTFINRVVALGLDGPVTDGDLDEIDAFFRERAARYVVPLAPGAAPGLEQSLRERGFEDGYAWMKFRRGTEPPPRGRTDLRVAEVHDGADFAAVLGAVWNLAELAEALPRLDGWHCFVAYEGDTPVATGALCLHGTAGWLGCAGTLPDHRGRGAQTAILAARLALAHSLGLDIVTTETGVLGEGRPDGSYRNILRAGFEEAYVRPNLLSPL